MSKQYDSGSSLQEKILKGVNTLTSNVASTLGPRGRNVILHGKNMNPIITKDGVTVARFVELDDPFENAGAQIIKQAASQTNNDAGDGTTTATVLAREILVQAQKYLISGVSPVELKRGMDKTVEAIVTNLKNMSVPISSAEDIAHIATISANGDQVIGNLVATAIDKVGKDGAISVEEARSLETTLDLVEGFRFDSGYLSTQFVTDERRGAAKHDDIFILVTDKSIELVEDLLPILEVVAREGRPLMIVADNIEGQALAALIMNAVRGTMRIVAVKAPRYGRERRNILKDLSISVDAQFISRETNLKLKDAKLEHLGKASSVEIYKNATTIVGGKGDLDQVEKRIEILKSELEQTDSIHDCERIQERITRLASGVGIIRVGGATEIEMVEKKHRIEDALEAVASAQMEGIVPGGGVALIRAAANLELEFDNSDQSIGSNIILEAVKAPIKQMAQNAGESPDMILNMIEHESEARGFDFSKGEVVNMFEAGIIDPAKVARVALQNATSVSSTLITTNYAIIKAD